MGEPLNKMQKGQEDQQRGLALEESSSTPPDLPLDMYNIIFRLLDTFSLFKFQLVSKYWWNNSSCRFSHLDLASSYLPSKAFDSIVNQICSSNLDTPIEKLYLPWIDRFDIETIELMITLLYRCSRALKHLNVPEMFLMLNLAKMPAFPALRRLEIYFSPSQHFLYPETLSDLKCNVLEELNLSKASSAPQLIDFATTFSTLTSLALQHKEIVDAKRFESMERLQRLVVGLPSIPAASKLSEQLLLPNPTIESFRRIFASLLETVPSRLGLNIRVYGSDSTFHMNILNSVALFGKSHESALASFVLAALELGIAPRIAVKFCIHHKLWDLLENCFQAGFRADERLEGGDTIFVALCSTDTPTRVISSIFSNYLDSSNQRVQFTSDLLLDASGDSVITAAAFNDLSVVNFVWLLEYTQIYGIDVNTADPRGRTALDWLNEASSTSPAIVSFGRRPVSLQKVRILLDRGARIDSIMPTVESAVLFEILNLYLEGKISLVEHLFGHNTPLLHRICTCDIRVHNLITMDRLQTVTDAISRLLRQVEVQMGQAKVLELIMQRDVSTNNGILEELLRAKEDYAASWDPLCAPRISAICSAITSEQVRSQFVNAIDPKSGISPLHRAGGAAYFRIMQVLIGAGADVNSVARGDTVLAEVLTSFQPGREILQAVRILLSSGANPTTPSLVLNNLPPLHWILRFLGTRGEVLEPDSSGDEADDGVRDVLGVMRQRNRRRNSRNQVISVESDYDSDSAEKSVDSFEIGTFNNSDEENDPVEWLYEDEMVQIAHLLLQASPVDLLHTKLAEGPIKEYPLHFLGDMCDRGHSSAAIALLQSMLKLGLDLTLPAHREILQSWRKKRSKLALLSSISSSRKKNSKKKQANYTKRSRGRSFGMFQDDEDDDDGFQHWL